jgi:hypothetical protein
MILSAFLALDCDCDCGQRQIQKKVQKCPILFMVNLYRSEILSWWCFRCSKVVLNLWELRSLCYLWPNGWSKLKISNIDIMVVLRSGISCWWWKHSWIPILSLSAPFAYGPSPPKVLKESLEKTFHSIINRNLLFNLVVRTQFFRTLNFSDTNSEIRTSLLIFPNL